MRPKSRQPVADAKEPLGIVIADGGDSPLAPRFSAFVWGPVPDDELDELSHDALLASGR